MCRTPCDDLSETVAAVCAAVPARREDRPVTSQYVEQCAGYGEQQDQRQPRRSRRGPGPFLSGDERNGSERPCDVNCKQQIHNPCVRAYSVPCRLKKDLEIQEYTSYLCCIMKIRVLAFTGQDSYFFTLFVLQGSPAAKGNTGGFWMWDGICGCLM